MGLPGRERSLAISSAVWLQSTNVTDRRTEGRMDTRTDGQTPGDSKDRAYTWRSKNGEVIIFKICSVIQGCRNHDFYDLKIRFVWFESHFKNKQISLIFKLSVVFDEQLICTIVIDYNLLTYCCDRVSKTQNGINMTTCHFKQNSTFFQFQNTTCAYYFLCKSDSGVIVFCDLNCVIFFLKNHLILITFYISQPWLCLHYKLLFTFIFAVLLSFWYIIILLW